jgi:Cys-tRNA synthase (O-phospho-L-seryl-tRNA:Cys-tRNA synthase)
MEIGARMGGDFIGSDLVQLSTGYDFVKGVIEVALGQFEVPVLTDNAYSGVYFLAADTSQVAHYIQQTQQYPAIVQAEQTDAELHQVTCSAERSGYFIYKDTKKFVIE